MVAQGTKKRQFDMLETHVFLVENRRRGRCLDNQGRYGWRVRDENILGLVFGQLDRCQSTVGKLW